MKQKTDSELMQAYRSGNMNAFETLYGRYGGRLYAYAYSLLKRTDEASDAMHEVFTKLIENAEAFCRANKLSSFLYTVCRNYCLNALKKRKHETTGFETAPFGLLMTGNPCGNAASHEEAQHLNMIIGTLPDEQREVLVLKVYSGLTFRQIAETTGQPQGTVATRYRSAMEQIKSALLVRGR